MKHLVPLVLLLAIISLPHSTATGDANATDANVTQLVYDIDGHEMNNYSSYYILQEKGTGKGGLKLNSLVSYNSFMIQAQSETNHGLPVKFKPLSAPSNGITHLSTDTKIVFAIISTRLEELYWYVPIRRQLPSSEPRQRVAIREYLKGPNGFVFHIERHIIAGATKGYKLVWCASATKPCKDLGMYESEGKTWLATSDSPFVVVFKKGVLADFHA